MRISIWMTAVTAVSVMLLVVLAGQMIIQPDVRLIPEAGFSLDTITPNADHDTDAATFSYVLARDAKVSLSFEDAEGRQYVFRSGQPRAAGEYQVDFSGVVRGYVLPGEEIAGDVVQRLIPDGTYTWRLTASTAEGESDEQTGQLIVRDADSPLPEMPIFEVLPNVFTPNQDGIHDRTAINIYLTKPADLTVYLESESGTRYFISARQEGRKPGEEGRHSFDYDGGVDQGADPPPDGTYTVIAEAHDDEGQLVRQATSLTIRNGGKPLAEIVPQTVGVDVVFDTLPYEDRYFSTAGALGDLIGPPDDPQAYTLTPITMQLGDMLVFKVTIENYGDVPIRTSGPPPGTVYQQDQNKATLGEYEQSGAWRVGINCETAVSDYPWRWAVGTADNLVAEEDPETGNTYYYLMPGERSVVWGGIHMTHLVPRRNPQNCWAGLIHEDVEISLLNNNVGRRQIELVDPNSERGDNN